MNSLLTTKLNNSQTNIPKETQPINIICNEKEKLGNYKGSK
jgi:hypothetical protein